MFKRCWWMMLAMMPVGLLGGLLLASVVTYVMPKKYESFATIEIKPRMGADLQLEPVSVKSLESESVKIKGRNNLTIVCENLDLTDKWGMDTESVIKILREIVETQRIKGTDLFSIKVRHTNKEEARDITTEVAKAYNDYRAELESEAVDKNLQELKQAVREQEDKVNSLLAVKPNLLHKTFESDEELKAKSDFETELALLEAMKLKLIEESMIQRAESESIVIHDDSIISNAPVSPNVMLNLIVGSAGGFLLSPLFALPLMWLMNRKSASRELLHSTAG